MNNAFVDELGQPFFPVVGEKGNIYVGGLKGANVEFIRPADTTAYIALDTIADSTSIPHAMKFENVVRILGGSGYIVKAQLATDQKTNVARFRLHLFSSSPTPINDNAPYTTLYANFPNRIGSIDFAALSTEDSSNSTQALTILTPGNGNIPLAFACNSSDKSIYALLETLDAFTPASAQKFYLKLVIDQN